MFQIQIEEFSLNYRVLGCQIGEYFYWPTVKQWRLVTLRTVEAESLAGPLSPLPKLSKYLSPCFRIMSNMESIMFTMFKV